MPRDRNKNRATILEDEISEELLASIPEDEGEENEASLDEELASFEATFAPEPIHVPTPGPRAEVQEVLSGIRREVESLFTRELDRVESSFSTILHDMEARLKAAEEQIESLETERTTLTDVNARYEKKFEALRQLADAP